jgi:hypothetical protein
VYWPADYYCGGGFGPLFFKGLNMPELELVRGSNSFDTFDNLKTVLDTMPNLMAATNAESAYLKPALVEAWYNLGALPVDFGNAISTTRYFGEPILDELTSSERELLKFAQIHEAEFILRTHPSERDATVRRISVGESSTVFRNNRQIIVAPAAVRILQPYIVQGYAHTAAIHP